MAAERRLIHLPGAALPSDTSRAEYDPVLLGRAAGSFGHCCWRTEVSPRSRLSRADRDTRIWGRIKPEDRSPYPDTICIVGHTPVNFLTGVSDQPVRIWHGDGIIDIDCGCGHQKISATPFGLSPAGRYGGVLCWEYEHGDISAQNVSIVNTCEMLVSVVYCIIRNV